MLGLVEPRDLDEGHRQRIQSVWFEAVSSVGSLGAPEGVDGTAAPPRPCFVGTRQGGMLPVREGPTETKPSVRSATSVFWGGCERGDVIWVGDALARLAGLETSPRGVYCGAIGYVAPSGEGLEAA